MRTKCFDELGNDRHRARLIDEAFPKCLCEQCSLGLGSPGPVANCEGLYRFFVSPADIDPKTNDVFATAFEKSAENGLSVFRSCASDDDMRNLVQDRLTVRAGKSPLTVLGLFRALARDLRAIQNTENQRAFCIYDETVPRKLDPSLPHVPTHVSIYQRTPPPRIPIPFDQVEKQKALWNQ